MTFEDKLPNPFAVDYQSANGPLNLYTEKEMFKYANIIINELSSILINQSENQESVQSNISPLFDAGMTTGLKHGYQHSAELIQQYFKDASNDI